MICIEGPDLLNPLFVLEIGLLDRIPAAPSRSDAQAICLDQGSALFECGEVGEGGKSRRIKETEQQEKDDVWAQDH